MEKPHNFYEIYKLLLLLTINFEMKSYVYLILNVLKKK